MNEIKPEGESPDVGSNILITTKKVKHNGKMVMVPHRLYRAAEPSELGKFWPNIKNGHGGSGYILSQEYNVRRCLDSHDEMKRDPAAYCAKHGYPYDKEREDRLDAIEKALERNQAET